MTTATNTYQLTREIISVAHTLTALCNSINEYESVERNKSFNERNEDAIRACESAWTACFKASSALTDLSFKL